MTYALYADEWPMHMIRLRLDRSDRHLFTELLAHCTRNLTDGLVDVPLRMLTDHPEPDEAVARLIEAGLVDEHPDGYVIAGDYMKHQRTREQAEADRERNRQRQQDYRDRGRRHRAGDHSICTKSCPHAGRNAVTNGVTNGVSNGAQSNPIQSDPKRGLERIGEEGRSADGAQERAPASPPSTVWVDESPPDIRDDAHVYWGEECCGLPEANRVHIPVAVEAQSLVQLLEPFGVVQVGYEAGFQWNVFVQLTDEVEATCHVPVVDGRADFSVVNMAIIHGRVTQDVMTRLAALPYTDLKPHGRTLDDGHVTANLVLSRLSDPDASVLPVLVRLLADVHDCLTVDQDDDEVPIPEPMAALCDALAPLCHVEVDPPDDDDEDDDGPVWYVSGSDESYWVQAKITAPDYRRRLCALTVSTPHPSEMDTPLHGMFREAGIQHTRVGVDGDRLCVQIFGLPWDKVPAVPGVMQAYDAHKRAEAGAA